VDSTSFDLETDALIVGSGGGGMVAALSAKAAGLDTVLIEKAAVFGGSTALSGGGVWIPNAPQLQKLGQHDDPQQVLSYLVNLAGDRVSRERLERYVDEGPTTMEFLETQSRWLQDAWIWTPKYSDYFPEQGGSKVGRGLWSKPIDKRVLGDDAKLLRTTSWSRLDSPPKGMWLTSIDVHSLFQIRWGFKLGPYRTVARLGWRMARARVLGEQMVAGGQALAIRLWLTLREAGIPVMLDTPMHRLITDAQGAVIGVETERDEKPYRIGARRGVLLATGGFERNEEMRRRYQPTVGKGWTRGSPDSQGDGQRAGEEVGGALDLMDDAWWLPSFQMPGGLTGGIAERQYPGQFIVNGAGRRFVNESTPYSKFGRTQIAGEEAGVTHIPAWMIFDEHAFKRNVICGHFPWRKLPENWLGSGLVKRADTIEGLAEQIGVRPDALRETQERFNGFARQGIDEDFHRGESVYDQYYGDPSQGKNPNLAEVKQPPYYAISLVPGDLGTKGGLLTDENARVLREDGEAIPGLYATGNASAAVMGNSYAGPGATIGPAIVFGRVAALHMAEAAERSAHGDRVGTREAT
jgi:succinate dehydrogenase/fumarate reductase flavoprotein subunit